MSISAHPQIGKLMNRTIRIFLILLISTVGLQAQQSALTLEQCYDLARSNYPTINQLNLLDQSNQLQIKNLNKNYLPTLELNAQATWQSQVTELPIDIPIQGFEVPTVSNDQYKATLDLRQTLWDGGITARSKEVQNASTQVEKQRTEVDLYSLKSRVNTLYFSILLADEQLRLNGLLQGNLKSRIQRAEALVDNGTATKANLNTLKAELLNAEGQAIEIKANRRTAIQSLSLLLNTDIPENATFAKPNENPIAINNQITRPEMTLFQYQSQLIAAQSDLLPAKNMPKFSVFATGGYGRPGLNFLDNDFTTYAILGAGLKWNFSELYNGRQSNDRQLLTIQQQQVDIQKRTFELNTNMQLRQLSNDIIKLQELLSKDREQITLRISIRETAEAQLDNGIITPSDYLTELNNENQARLNLAVHELQLLLAQTNYKVTIGQ